MLSLAIFSMSELWGSNETQEEASCSRSYLREGRMIVARILEEATAFTIGFALFLLMARSDSIVLTAVIVGSLGVATFWKVPKQ